MGKTSWVYIMTNRPNGVLYIGVTSDLKGRVAKHKNKTYAKSFTAQYNLDKLVYFEKIDGIVKAICKLPLFSGRSLLEAPGALGYDWMSAGGR